MEEKYQRDFKGVWIPKEIWLNRDLSVMEKLFLVEIDSLDNEQGCFASNKHFSDFFDISKGRCTQIIKSLEEKGLVSIKHEYKGKQIIRRTIRVVNKVNKVDNELNGVVNNLNEGSEKTKQGCLENDEDNNTINNPINNPYNKQTSNKLPEKDLKEDFDSIWKEYPNKKGKAKAFTSYKKAIKEGVDNQTIINGISAYKKEIEIKRTEPEYIAHGSTWFGQQRWEDDYQTKGKVINSAFAQEAPTTADNIEVSDEEERMYQEYLRKQGKA